MITPNIRINKARDRGESGRIEWGEQRHLLKIIRTYNVSVWSRTRLTV